jgi:hypothetical protein
MAKVTDPRGSADWVREKLAALRASLESGEGWPDSADRLLDDLLAAEQAYAPLSDEEVVLLSLVIGDALQGVDVAAQYPHFYEKLLQNKALRDAFLDGLALLDEGELLAPRGTVPSAAEVAPLDFLRTPVSTGVVEVDESGWWRVQWLQLKGALERLLSPAAPLAGMAWRSGEGMMDEGYRTLLRSEAAVGGQTIHIALDGRQPVEKPDVLELSLMVAADGDEEVGPLRARLEWGEYGDSAVLDGMGMAMFEPVPLALVWEEGVTADLQLVVERGERET